MRRLVEAAGDGLERRQSFFKYEERAKSVKLAGLEEYATEVLLRLLLLLWQRGELEKFKLANIVLPFVGSRYKMEIHVGSAESVFYFSGNYKSRRDHRELFERTVEASGSPSVVTCARKLSIRLGHLRLIPLAVSWNKSLKEIGLPLEVRIALIVYLAESFMTVKEIKANGVLEGAKYFVTFLDEYPDEVMLVESCRAKGIKTAVLQHGAYPGPALDDEDVMTMPYLFKFSTADRIFVWGEFWRQRGIACGVEPSRLLVLGNPRYSGHGHRWRDCSNRIETIGLVLDANIEMNRASNNALAEIVTRYCIENSIKCIVRYHPNCDAELRERLADCPNLQIDRSDTIKEFSDSVDLAVCARSTVYIELIYWGVPLLRYVVDDALDTYPEISVGKFRDYDSFAHVLRAAVDNSAEFAEELLRATGSFFRCDSVEDAYREELTK